MAKEPRSLHGKVVAITGGARGIGKATAQSLSREGAKIAIGDLDKPLADEVASSLGTEAIGLEVDVTDRDSFANFLDQVSERLGPIDVMINNAGIMPIGPFVDETDATAQRMVDINLHGVIYGMKLTIPGMKQRGSGSHRQHRFAGREGRSSRRRHLLRDQACRRRPERGSARGAPRHRDRGLGGDAGGGQHRARLRASGYPRRGKLEPEDVAEAIVEALKFPKFDVWVPASSAVIDKLIHPLPAPRQGGDRSLHEGRPGARRT